jgi:hypothetical protein
VCVCLVVCVFGCVCVIIAACPQDLVKQHQAAKAAKNN